jgi:hypothetical protein
MGGVVLLEGPVGGVLGVRIDLLLEGVEIVLGAENYC